MKQHQIDYFIELLTEFEQFDTTKHHFWSRNQAAKALKSTMKRLGHWKNRGKTNNPAGNAASLPNSKATTVQTSVDTW